MSLTERGGGSIDAVVFDMGGVIVKLAPLSEVLTGVDLAPDELMERWILSDAVSAFEAGRCTADEFAADLVAEFDLPFGPAEAIERVTRFPQGLFDGARELLHDLRGRVPIAILSNTNELHWTTQTDHEFLQSAFDHEYLSYEIGLVKPHREIYDYVVVDLGVSAERVLFLDDNQINVDGARAAGLRSEVAKGPAAARQLLAGYGLF